MNMQNNATELNIRVKSGNLAAQGKGKVAITHMPDGQFRVEVLLPGEGGTPEPLDLTTVERVELVKTKTGWFGKGQWIKPLAATIAGTIVVPFGVPTMIALIKGGEVIISTAYALFLFGSSMGASYASGVYTGTKLTRVARFVVTTQDGKHAVLEGPESVFRFMSGVYAAPNIQLEAVDSEAPSAPSGEPVPTPA
jgi:hypothetical protein